MLWNEWHKLQFGASTTLHMHPLHISVTITLYCNVHSKSKVLNKIQCERAFTVDGATLKRVWLIIFVCKCILIYVQTVSTDVAYQTLSQIQIVVKYTGVNDFFQLYVCIIYGKR